MSETLFAGDWLALREPADHAARNPLIRDRVVAALGARSSLVILDLGAGTGSSARALAPHLGGHQVWRLVDVDRAHLDRAIVDLASVRDRTGGPIAVERHECDLTGELPAWLFDGVDLIVTSAFFDLVSRSWLRRLAARAQAVKAIVYAALTVDGRLAAEPLQAEDTAVFDAFNRHMLADKGFGGALGPRAPDIASHEFRAAGFRVASAKADWSLGAAAADLQRHLLGFWAGAARDLGSPDAEALSLWHRRRLAAIEAGTSVLTVGHVDMVAIPADD